VAVVKSTGRRTARARKHTPDYLVIGRVLRPQGVRGELRLEVQTDSPGHLSELEKVYVGSHHTAYALTSFRMHRGVLLVSLSGITDRDEADRLRGEIISISLKDAAPLKAGEYYHHQIIGLNVVTDAGEALGQVVEIIQTGANDVYVTRGPAGEVLLPAIKSVILAIEPPQMVVHLLEGLRAELPMQRKSDPLTGK
jgi:16S rRNA processing protein RimM